MLTSYRQDLMFSHLGKNRLSKRPLSSRRKQSTKKNQWTPINQTKMQKLKIKGKKKEWTSRRPTSVAGPRITTIMIRMGRMVKRLTQMLSRIKTLREESWVWSPTPSSNLTGTSSNDFWSRLRSVPHTVWSTWSSTTLRQWLFPS